MKVIVTEFSQESNSFCPIITRYEDFGPWGRYDGNGKTEVDGVLNALRESGAACILGPTLRAQASGPVQQAAVDRYFQELKDFIGSAADVDGVCMVLHGATQSTERDDVCGDLVSGVRELLGKEKVISVSVDLHGNVTQRMYENADFVCGFQTYPHRDQYETGYRAGALCVKKMQGALLYGARVEIPMIVPASAYTTEDGDFGVLVHKAHGMVDEHLLVDYTICQMQPWLDVAKGGTTVLTVSDSQENARVCAVKLAQELAGIRGKMWPDVKSCDAIIDAAESGAYNKPIIVSDFSDSPNAGATGDDISMLERLVARGAKVKAAVIVNDPHAVEQAFACGVGATAKFRIGGSLDENYGKYIDVEAKVRSLHDGVYTAAGPALQGEKLDIGLSAVLTVGEVDILLSNAMKITGDIQLYRHFGIEPSFYQLVLVKANTSFKAAYAQVSDVVMVIDTCRASTANLTKLPFKRIPKAFYPFSDIADFDAAQQVTVRQVSGK